MVETITLYTSFFYSFQWVFLLLSWGCALIFKSFCVAVGVYSSPERVVAVDASYKSCRVCVCVCVCARAFISLVCTEKRFL
jgi:hypothetical protein